MDYILPMRTSTKSFHLYITKSRTNPEKSYRRGILRWVGVDTRTTRGSDHLNCSKELQDTLLHYMVHTVAFVKESTARNEGLNTADL